MQKKGFKIRQQKMLPTKDSFHSQKCT